MIQHKKNSLNMAISKKIERTIFDRRRKLTIKQVEEIKELYIPGRKPSQRDIAQMYGVSQMTICAIFKPGVNNRKSPYPYTREQKTMMNREHREYKHKLLLDKKIA